MRKNNSSNSESITEQQSTSKKECFVIMPISDRSPYGEGHFKIVYEHLIKPACVKAGFTPIRADEIKETNFIVKDILKRILNSDMAICDLSGQNPNVLFELGIRQSFNLPVTIIKDIITPRIFDIDGLRCIDYDENLRIDKINLSINIIAETLKNTYESRENSLIESLSVTPAQIPHEKVLSDDTSILLEAIKDINDQLKSLRSRSNRVYGIRIIQDKMNLPLENFEPDISYKDIHWLTAKEAGVTYDDALWEKSNEIPKHTYTEEDIMNFSTETNKKCLDK